MLPKTKIPESGNLLLSEPFMTDPNFKRTVLLICEHLNIDGTVGFILNKSLGVKVSEAIVNFESVDNELFYGGPVAQDSLHYLHYYGEIIEDSMHITDSIYWGGNFEQLTNLLKDGTIDKKGVKFFLGYSGWSAGQLEDEMEENSWISTPAKKEYVFDNAHKELWKKILNDLGGDYKKIIHYPEDPKLN